MAFMLMSDMEAVVREIARVLAPGGRFVTVVGGGPAGEDGFHLFVSLLNQLDRGERERAPRIGDRRARTEEGMRELFSDAGGFGQISVEPLTLRTDGPPEVVFGSLMQMYGPELLSDANRDVLGARFMERAVDLVRADGALPCTEWLRVFTILRK
jgi:SAM-dependent methyltransferase